MAFKELEPSDLWGKLDPREQPTHWHPLVNHCLDVATVGRALLDDGSQVALGDATGVALLDPGHAGAAWLGGALHGADDLWLLGADGATFLRHYDGATWAEVPVPLPAYDLALSDDGVVLVGGSLLQRVAMAGDLTGIDVELDGPGIDGLDALTIDDADGTVWAFGDVGAPPSMAPPCPIAHSRRNRVNTWRSYTPTPISRIPRQARTLQILVEPEQLPILRRPPPN